MLKASDINY